MLSWWIQAKSGLEKPLLCQGPTCCQETKSHTVDGAAAHGRRGKAVRRLLAQSSASLRAEVLGLLPLIGGEAVTSLL